MNNDITSKNNTFSNDNSIDEILSYLQKYGTYGLDKLPSLDKFIFHLVNAHNLDTKQNTYDSSIGKILEIQKCTTFYKTISTDKRYKTEICKKFILEKQDQRFKGLIKEMHLRLKSQICLVEEIMRENEIEETREIKEILGANMTREEINNIIEQITNNKDQKREQEELINEKPIKQKRTKRKQILKKEQQTEQVKPQETKGETRVKQQIKQKKEPTEQVKLKELKIVETKSEQSIKQTAKQEEAKDVTAKREKPMKQIAKQEELKDVERKVNKPNKKAKCRQQIKVAEQTNQVKLEEAKDEQSIKKEEPINKPELYKEQPIKKEEPTNQEKQEAKDEQTTKQERINKPEIYKEQSIKKKEPINQVKKEQTEIDVKPTEIKANQLINSDSSSVLLTPQGKRRKCGTRRFLINEEDDLLLNMIKTNNEPDPIQYVSFTEEMPCNVKSKIIQDSHLQHDQIILKIEKNGENMKKERKHKKKEKTRNKDRLCVVMPKERRNKKTEIINSVENSKSNKNSDNAESSKNIELPNRPDNTKSEGEFEAVTSEKSIKHDLNYSEMSKHIENQNFDDSRILQNKISKDDTEILNLKNISFIELLKKSRKKK
ncbi:uncharacterized protein VNE69_01012 [Vairimorpha necatrix]|uniref:Uncharacterized protein n=1 Tax=Vairimorpha necatrix TaxID=6039 RepID=A0AAX4J7L6_9MICR